MHTIAYESKVFGALLGVKGAVKVLTALHGKIPKEMTAEEARQALVRARVKLHEAYDKLGKDLLVRLEELASL